LFSEKYYKKSVLTYNWGDSFKRYLENGTQLRGDKFGVAPTPGSTKVLDRESMQLVDCDENRCQYGTFYDDIGWVNRAPNLAFGGYACSVNNYTDPVRKRLAMEFCAFAASKKESIKAIIPNATDYDATFLNGQDPFRHSHLNLDVFVQQGYERTASQDYIATILVGLDSVNAVVDPNFPTAAEILAQIGPVLDPYLNSTRYDGLIPDGAEREAARLDVAQRLERRWQEIMDDYESQDISRPSILEAYQRLRGVYSINYNHLSGSIRAFGYVLVALALGSSLVSVIWVLKHRKTHIVRASQPFFLVLISLGAAILGSSIIPMGIDDGVASVETCNRACMATPWLLVLGWTIVFAALFSKLVRMCMVFNSAVRFRRVTVTEADVLHYFAILLACNLVLLLVWTFVTPMKWTRLQTSRTESYGKCVATGEKVAWHTIISLVTVVNGIALIMANVQAYRARRISTEYGESRFIGMAMISILQVVVVGIPVLLLVDENPMARYFMQVTIAFVISMSILIWMYVPKMQAWWFQRNERSSASSARGLAFRLVQSDTVSLCGVGCKHIHICLCVFRSHTIFFCLLDGKHESQCE
jgi:7 transmembrane sweet-taste receptor of 3 GCPR